MTDSYGYFPIPVIPTATGNPTSFTHATTILEIIDQLRNQLQVLSDIIDTYDDNFNALVGNVNQACQSAISACTQLSTTAATMNSETATQIDTAVADLAAAQLTLTTALTSAQAANTAATAVSTAYTADVARQDQSIADQFEMVNEKISGYVTQNTIVYNVKDYGAVGDGVTDDSAAVINTLTAAAGGGIIFFPKGRYLITQALVIPRNAMVQGIGCHELADGSIDQGLVMNVPPAATVNNAMITMGPAAVMKDIGITGPGSGTGIYCSGSCHFDNVNVHMFSTAFNLTNLWYGYFNNLRLFKNSEGFNCNYCYNVKFIDPQFTFRDWNDVCARGFTLNQQIDIACIGGSIESYDTAFKYGLQVAQHVSLIGVYFEANAPVRNYTSQYGAMGVDMTNTTQCSIYVSGCHIYLSNTHAFIRANSAQRGVITSIGNKIKGGTGTSSMVCLANYCQSNGGSNIARVMIGDDMTSVNPNPTIYISPGQDGETHSLIVIPLGGTQNG